MPPRAQFGQENTFRRVRFGCRKQRKHHKSHHLHAALAFGRRADGACRAAAAHGRTRTAAAHGRKASKPLHTLRFAMDHTDRRVRAP